MGLAEGLRVCVGLVKGFDWSEGLALAGCYHFDVGWRRLFVKGPVFPPAGLPSINSDQPPSFFFISPRKVEGVGDCGVGTYFAFYRDSQVLAREKGSSMYF